MPRTVTYAAGLLLCLLVFTTIAQAQLPTPHSYAFVEVEDTNGQPVSDANIRLADTERNDLLKLKTDKDGKANGSFMTFRGCEGFHFEVTKSGYQFYESVLFALGPERYRFNLTDSIPKSDREAGTDAPIKIVLARPPSTPVEIEKFEAREPQRQLVLSAKRRNVDEVRRLLELKVDPNSKDPKGVPVILWASFLGQAEIIKLLLDAGADVRTRGSNALLIYLAYGARSGVAQEVVDQLINAGADINAPDSGNGTVLTRIINQMPDAQALTMAKRLIAAGSDVNAPGTSRRTPLMFATYRNRPDMIELLLASGATRSLNAQDEIGYTALLLAASGNNDAYFAILKTLIASGATLTTVNKDGETALMVATRSASLEAMKTLLKAGASITAKDQWGRSALMHTVSVYFSPDRNAAQLVRLLLAAGANINEVDNKGRSFLMHAVAAISDADFINFILLSGANVNVIDAESETALLLAARVSRADVVKALLQGGAAATINAKDQKGKTALQYATESNREDVRAMLIAAGASVDRPNQ